MSSKLCASYRNLLSTDDSGYGRIDLVEGGEETALCREWKSARALLARIHAKAKSITKDDVYIAAAFVDLLKPDCVIPWEKDENEATRLLINLVPSPGSLVYCGGAMMNLPVGQVTALNTRLLHSEINMGPVSRINLVIDIANGQAHE